jgi:hypothetical protein
MSPSVAILAAELVVAQQQHRPPGAAHFVLLAGVVLAVLAIFGVRWWRRRHEVAEAEWEPTAGDRSQESTDSTEEQRPGGGSPGEDPPRSRRPS